jgi:hypothetical protein
MHQLRTAELAPFGISQHGGQHRRARVDRPKMRIVEIENMRTDAVQQRRMQNIGALGAAQQLRLRHAEKRRKCAARAGHRIVARSPYRTAEPIEQPARRLVDDRGGQIIETRVDDITRERSRDGGGHGRLRVADWFGERYTARGRSIFQGQLIVM